MTFPFSIIFNESLKTIITPDNKEQVLQYIKKSILEDKADDVSICDMEVNYKGSTSNWRGSLFGSVDKGNFNLCNKDNVWFLKYEINMRQLFISTSIMSIAISVFEIVTGGLWWFGFVAFIWLCGGNWIINFARHASVASEIATGIDDLIYYKEHPIENNENKEVSIENDEDKEKLKSWY